MPFNQSQTRSPKQIGDFGEGLVTYTLIRKGFEVAVVDHVGADLIAEKEKRRFAVSVKTRMFREQSTESRGVVINQSDIDKLIFFSDQFNMIPLFAYVYILVKERTTHLAMLPMDVIYNKMSNTKAGYRMDILQLIHVEGVDHSYWKEEKLGGSDFIHNPTFIEP